jgi:hypothetical protein
MVAPLKLTSLSATCNLVGCGPAGCTLADYTLAGCTLGWRTLVGCSLVACTLVGLTLVGCSRWVWVLAERTHCPLDVVCEMVNIIDMENAE